MGDVISILERCTAIQMERVTEKLDALAGNIDHVVRMAEQRLKLVADLIEAIEDPAIGDRLLAERQDLLNSLNAAKSRIETHLEEIRKLSAE